MKRVLLGLSLIVISCLSHASADNDLLTRGGTSSGLLSATHPAFENLPPRAVILVVQWIGYPCADEIVWHWGLGEHDHSDMVEAVDTTVDQCNRSFRKRHTFLTGARRQVWATFFKDGEELGRTDPVWVKP